MLSASKPLQPLRCNGYSGFPKALMKVPIVLISRLSGQQQTASRLLPEALQTPPEGHSHNQPIKRVKTNCLKKFSNLQKPIISAIPPPLCEPLQDSLSLFFLSVRIPRDSRGRKFFENYFSQKILIYVTSFYFIVFSSKKCSNLLLQYRLRCAIIKL